jgi:hypothetical protein
VRLGQLYAAAQKNWRSWSYSAHHCVPLGLGPHCPPAFALPLRSALRHINHTELPMGAQKVGRHDSSAAASFQQTKPAPTDRTVKIPRRKGWCLKDR